jgi:hypothetical protein
MPPGLPEICSARNPSDSIGHAKPWRVVQAARHDMDQIMFAVDSFFDEERIGQDLSTYLVRQARTPCLRGTDVLRRLKNEKKRRVTCELVHTKVLTVGNVWNI